MNVKPIAATIPPTPIGAKLPMKLVFQLGTLFMVKKPAPINAKIVPS
jgi:hypothetical protein